jgi:ribosomal protein S18 acetylase RimI-like enzyme
MTTSPETARSDDWPAALALLFQYLDAEARDCNSRDVLAQLAGSTVNPEGLFVLREAGAIVGVQMCVPLPGAMALMWLPQSRDGPRRIEREDRLLQHAQRWLRDRGVKLAQALFPCDGLPDTAALERHGFDHLTRLWYLRHRLDAAIDRAPSRLDVRRADTDHPTFVATLLRSYQGTLDCPEINGVRTVDEILEGHRSQGLHDPGLWWLAKLEGQPAGVALLARMPETGDWDVAYVGVVPELRRRGIGRDLMLRILHACRADRAAGVTVSVDGRNSPACQLYRQLGFEPVDRREVLLAIWRQKEPRTE